MERPPKPDSTPAPPLPTVTRRVGAGTRPPSVKFALATSTPLPPPQSPAPQLLPPPSAETAGPVILEAELVAASSADPSASSASASPTGAARFDPAATEIEGEPTHFTRGSLHTLPSLARFGRYELLGRLAFGGMAEIFLARETAETTHTGGRYIVVKRVLPHVAEDTHFVEMFVDEARLAMQLSHAHICHIYGFGEEQGSYYLAMEWIDGMPLSKVIRRAREQDGGLPLVIALKIIAQVADALDYAHRACDQMGEPLGIVHRDVSPQNVMVSFDGPVKLLDFGIAKATSHSTRTEAGIVKGKFAYMSPQQCLGEPIDARADVFALGLCLYEVLHGTNPFRRQTEFDTMRAIVYEDAPPIADSLMSREVSLDIVHLVEHVVARAIAKKPEERFQSAGELQFALEQVIARMGEVVTSSRIGEQMHELFDAEIKAGPRLDARSSIPPSALHSEAELPAVVLPAGATEKLPASTAERDPRESMSSLPPAKRAQRGALAMVALLLFAVVGGAGAWIAYTFGTMRASTEVASASPAAVGVAVASPAPTTGSLYVDSVPPGATIELGDRGVVGTTPADLAMLEPGVWYVRLHREGRGEWERSIEVRAGERAHLLADLPALAPSEVVDLDLTAPDVAPSEIAVPAEAAPLAADDTPSRSRASERSRASAREGSSRVRGEPGRLSINSRPWSRVYIGPRMLGTTPIGDVEVESGTLRLRLVDRDGLEHARSITVAPGGHERAFFDLRERDLPGSPAAATAE
jgi:serine/threonine protein kinase